MKKLLFLVFALGSSCFLFAQDETVQALKKDAERTIQKDPNDTTSKTWKTGGFVGINAAQGSLSNWAAGGDKFSLAVNGNLSLYAFHKKNKHTWDNTLDINLGYINTTSLGSRKNDDRIDLLSKYGYAIGPKWNVGALFNFRSQLFKGYAYDDDGNRTFNSNFFSPAYVLLSPGVEWKPNNEFSAFISPATVRWTIVKNDSLAAVGAYGVDPGKHSRTEFGAFASLNYMKEINKMFSYKSRMDLYSNYLKNPKNIDVYWTNMINMKLTKFLTLTYSLDLIYDDDVKLFGENNDSPATQIKSMLGLGFLVKF
ncbi:hypothetical protein PIECOFPK_00937 [Mycovorax composti]|mgnify:CR=1 FL=1|jgi:Protein of unknown function (DUF3078).|uniref:DUF3078 domain-containing protein n=2 Tax=Chitinophagaceae TaxID=563835 RepID=A0ABZ2EIL0_9BACT